jgi:hypothetical protein
MGYQQQAFSMSMMLVHPIHMPMLMMVMACEGMSQSSTDMQRMLT